MNEEVKSIKIRAPKKEDLLDIFLWRNDPITIKMSLRGKSVSFEEHKNWFNKLLQNKNIKMYILESAGIAIGVIRYDKCEFKKNTYETTINIAPNKRGMGLGKILLSKTILLLWEEVFDCKYVRAKIKDENLNSQKIFKNCGFKVSEIKNNIITFILEKQKR